MYYINNQLIIRELMLHSDLQLLTYKQTIAGSNPVLSAGSIKTYSLLILYNITTAEMYYKCITLYLHHLSKQLPN